MVTKELSETAVELNAILENTSSDVMEKIPQKLIKFFKENKSETYKFSYDKSKSLNDQNIKPLTKGCIALIYRDYICNDKEKSEYIKKCDEFYKKQEEEKEQMYSVDNIFKINQQEQNDTNNTEKLVPIKKIKWYTKFANFFKKAFR